MSRRRITLTLGTAAGGLLAAAFLPMAVASADLLGPAPFNDTLEPTQVTGQPPFSPEVIMGPEQWGTFDFTTGQFVFGESFPAFSGVDTETIMGSTINNDFATQGFSVDLLDTGHGWANEFVFVPNEFGPIGGAHMGELLITPFGDFTAGNLDFATFFGTI